MDRRKDKTGIADTVCRLHRQGYAMHEIISETLLSVREINKIIAKTEQEDAAECTRERSVLICRELRRIRDVENQYWRRVNDWPEEDNKFDSKLLQGIERCIGLRVALLGLNDKRGFAIPENDRPEDEIDLSRLSESTLIELAALKKRPADGI